MIQNITRHVRGSLSASALDLKWRGLGSRHFALTVPPPRVPMNYQRSLMKKLEGKLLLPHKAGKIPAPWITLLDPFLGLYYFMLQDNCIKHQVCFIVWKFFLSIERSYWLPWGHSVPQHSWKCNIPTGVKICWTKSRISQTHLYIRKKKCNLLLILAEIFHTIASVT